MRAWHALPVLAALALSPSAQCELADITPVGVAFSGNLGWSAATDGTTTLVGAPFDHGSATQSGTVFVHRFTLDKGWELEQELVPSLTVGFQHYGFAVDLENDVAVVGARRTSPAGAAYVYERTGTTWVEVAALQPTDGQPGDEFGNAVSISGSTLFVGAWGDHHFGIDSGTVYVYEKIGSTWTQVGKLVSDDRADTDLFGSAVMLDGDTALITAPYDDDRGPDSGSVYAFERTAPGATTWVQTQKLVASDGAAGDAFGFKAARSGDRAILGAWGDDASRGSAYVLDLAGGTWGESAKLVASNGAAGDTFGFAVGIDGDRAAVGAYFADAAGADSGSAYLFEREPSGWVETEILGPPTLAAGDHFGYSVAVGRDTTVVGARWASFANSGGAHISTCSTLHGQPHELSVASGGAQELLLDAGPAFASLPYLVLGSSSGTAPGLFLDGHYLPLASDSYTLATLLTPNAPPLSGSFGTLDGTGRASATFAVPTGLSPTLVGLELHHAYVVIELLPTLLHVVLASNAVPVELVP